MGINTFPAPSAASKTMFRTTLTSGTSYTVPAGVTYLNVTTVGGGGGGAPTANDPITTAVSGRGGSMVSSTLSATAGATISYAIGAGGAAGTGANTGGAGGTTTFTGATSASGGNGGAYLNNSGTAGPNFRGADNGGNPAGGNSNNGGAGGSGCIIVEYWAQEIIMDKLFAVVENNKVVNIIVGVEDEVVAANPGKYIEYTNGWDYNNGIDGGVFFPVPVEPTEE